MATSRTSSVRFHRIGTELRRCREEMNLTLEVASRMLGRSASSLSKIETGSRIIRPRDLEYILTKYGFDRESTEALLELSRQGTRRGWWHRYTAELTPMAMDFISLEADATSIRTYQMALIPGLLQTPGYARALIESAHTPGPVQVNKALEIRLRRQRILHGATAPNYLVLLGEAALRNQVGSLDVMHGQLQHLLDASASKRAVLRILPFGCCASSRLEGSFSVLEIGQQAGLIVVMAEALGQIIYQESRQDVMRAMNLIEHLHHASLSESASNALIRQVQLEWKGLE